MALLPSSSFVSLLSNLFCDKANLPVLNFYNDILNCLYNKKYIINLLFEQTLVHVIMHEMCNMFILLEQWENQP